MSEFAIPLDSLPLPTFDKNSSLYSLSKEELILLMTESLVIQDTLLSKISTLETLESKLSITPPKSTDAQRRASLKWISSNRAKVNASNCEYAKRTNYVNNNRWKSENKEACAQYQREYRARKKAEKVELSKKVESDGQ